MSKWPQKHEHDCWKCLRITRSKVIWIICPVFCMVYIGCCSIVIQKSIKRSLPFFSAGLIWFFLRTAGWYCHLSCWKFFPEFVNLECHSKMKCFNGTLQFLRRLYFESFSGHQSGVTAVTFLAGNFSWICETKMSLKNEMFISFYILRKLYFESLSGRQAGVTVVIFLA